MEKREISYLVLWVVSAMLLRVCAACPELCECPRSHHVLCSNRGLSHVPHSGRTVRVLGLAGNFISNITPHDFVNYNHLTRLDLQFNQIRRVHPHAFSKLVELEELYLGYNLISVVQPGTLQPLKKLSVLYSNNNNIRELTGEAFKNLENVLKLRLDKNSIKLLNESLFRHLPNLIFLHLESNQIDHIHSKAFSTLEKLQFLNLSDNKQKELSDIFMFSHLKSLLTLLLSGNQITYIGNHVFQNLQKLTKLSLNNNKIVRLENEALKGLLRLRELRINQNELTRIPERLFEPVEHLEHLDLSNNHIRRVSPSMFTSLAQLKILNLSNNWLARLPGHVFTLNAELSHLDLSGNNWTCDCHVEKLKDWIVETHARGKLLTTLVQCRHPPALKGKLLDYVNHTMMVSEGNNSTYCQMDQKAEVKAGQESGVVEALVSKEERLKRGGEKDQNKMIQNAKRDREKPTRKSKTRFRSRTQEQLDLLLHEEADHYEPTSEVVTNACHFNHHYILNVSMHNITSDTATVSWSTATNIHANQVQALMFRVLFDRFGHAFRFPRYVYTDGTGRAVTLQELHPDFTYIVCVESVVNGTLCHVAPRDHCVGFVTLTSGKSEVSLQHMTAAVLMANALLLLFVGGLWLGRVLRRRFKRRKSSAHFHVRHMYSTRRPFRSAMATTCVSSEFSGYQSGPTLAEEGDLIQFPTDRFF